MSASPAEFYYRGLYRVQSRTRRGTAEIHGNWLEDPGVIVDSARINAELLTDPRAVSCQPINLRAANIWRRKGVFEAEPDILYKQEFFEPDRGSAGLPCNVVDARKSLCYWEKRWLFIEELFGSTARRLAELIPDLITVIANEYFCHEAGHSLGYPVEKKYRDGYFRPQGRLAWPLVWTEEFRADLHSFGYALRVLPERQAVAVFVYNVILRLGLDCSSARDVADGYGVVPFLLYSTLRDFGLVSVERQNGKTFITMDNLNPHYLIEIMKRCDRHADESLTSAELSSTDRLDDALRAAMYYRERLLNKDYLGEYQEAINCASKVIR